MVLVLCGQVRVTRAGQPVPTGVGGMLGERSLWSGSSVPLVCTADGILNKALPWGKCL